MPGARPSSHITLKSVVAADIFDAEPRSEGWSRPPDRGTTGTRSHGVSAGRLSAHAPRRRLRWARRRIKEGHHRWQMRVGRWPAMTRSARA
jgi:hypothetical protein